VRDGRADPVRTAPCPSRQAKTGRIASCWARRAPPGKRSVQTGMKFAKTNQEPVLHG
jgi:hypothetical protein